MKKLAFHLIFVSFLNVFFLQGWSFERKTISETVLEDSTPSDSGQRGIGFEETLVIQNVKYSAPNSGAVFVVWRTEQYPAENCVMWNPGTRISKGLLYSQMQLLNDTFVVDLKLPQKSTIYYYFWITKSKSGHYQDFWDLKANGVKTIGDNRAIVAVADYSQKAKPENRNIVDKGLYLLAFLITIFLMLVVLVRKNIGNEQIDNHQYYGFRGIVFLSISLLVFHAIARADIIHVGITSTLRNISLLGEIARGSIDDFRLVLMVASVFLCSYFFRPKLHGKKIIYFSFVVIAVILTVFAFTNITTVIFLGKPVTYQWLYYADFLESNEAKSALSTNLSLWTILNLIALAAAMIVFALLLEHFFRLVSSIKGLMYIVFSLIGVGLVWLSIISLSVKPDWTKGESENAVLALIRSYYSANANGSFFTTELSEANRHFSPLEGQIFDSAYDTVPANKIHNLLFIVLESAGAVYFDDFGGKFEISKNLSRYSKKALIFDQAYAHAPATNRTLVSILGSMYPYLSYKSLTQEAPGIEMQTLSSVLKNKGFSTSFFSSADLSFQNCRQFLMNRGFDVIEDYTRIQCDDTFYLDTDYKEGNGKDDMCLAERLDSWLDDVKKANFFSMIWTVQGHYPYFFKGEERDFRVNDISFNRYLNCLQHNDELVGKVMQMLEDKGLASSTLVVVVGDHGEAFGQHNQYGHGTALFEENLKVPLYFINENLFNGERREDIVGMKDLATTALNILQIETPERWQGRNLLASKATESFYFAPWSDYLFGYRKDSLKFIFNETHNTFEVYNIQNDPGEKVDLSTQLPSAEISIARERISAWVQFQDKYMKELLGDQTPRNKE